MVSVSNRTGLNARERRMARHAPPEDNIGIAETARNTEQSQSLGDTMVQ
jgi:hypothetical protein